MRHASMTYLDAHRITHMFIHGKTIDDISDTVCDMCNEGGSVCYAITLWANQEHETARDLWVCNACVLRLRLHTKLAEPDDNGAYRLPGPRVTRDLPH